MQFRNHHFGVSVATSSVASPILASDPGRFVMSAQGNPPTSVGLSPTEARPGGGPKFIRADTEARSEIRQATSAAPPTLRTLPRSRPWTVRQVSLSEHERSAVRTNRLAHSN